MILLMGIAGSGKGTQGKMLADQRDLHLISMGDVIRMYVTGEQRQRMLAGGLLDDAEVIHIVDQLLKSLPQDEEIILDGFPRTVAQAEWLLEQTKADRFQIRLAFHLEASREAVKQRLLGRGRIDDVEESIEKRFDEYERSTVPLIKWLAEQGVKVVPIDAERPPAEVNANLLAELDKADPHDNAH